ncbi:sigma factor-like helix-turn-helix DNA-binding protein [Ornithinimicrobium sp. LYQ121]|uniref:sigma factor-like helix-turn-helix DNA-binding protein n=1 Tax=Ornithinimicrobium sp. LYQ121 TaxID=3378801 RepID=UPI0038554732
MPEDCLTYSRDDTEALLHTLWTNSPRSTPRQPDPQLRRFKPTRDPRRTCDFWDHRADISRAWQIAPLTDRQRQALVLRSGMGLTMKQTGELLGGITASSVSALVDRGLVALMTVLNRHAGDASLSEAEAVVERVSVPRLVAVS